MRTRTCDAGDDAQRRGLWLLSRCRLAEAIEVDHAPSFANKLVALGLAAFCDFAHLAAEFAVPSNKLAVKESQDASLHCLIRSMLYSHLSQFCK
jgi:hypothetical protein